MKKTLNSTAVSTFYNLDTIAYCFKVTALVIAIPLVCFLELTHGENKTAAIPEVKENNITVLSEQTAPFILNKNINF